MKDKIQNYIMKIENIIPNQLCDQVVGNISKLKSWYQHTYYSADGKLTPVKRAGKNELWCTHWQNELNTKLEKIAVESAKVYLDYYKFDWFNALEKLTKIRYNRYASKQEMKLHCDHIKTIFDGEIKGVPILSIIGNLNDNYEGGQFIMDKEEIFLKKGDILIFPSNFLYPHKVKPIKKGKRYSFVSWAF